MPGSHRAHTPIVSEKQRGLFGAECARRKAGKKGKMHGITEGELEGHLEEAGGKKLPAAKGLGCAKQLGVVQEALAKMKKRWVVKD
jgi:hypothetical protein